ncbi:flavin reductase family protein [Terriglobus aquaticus]|uniref:Flavin reductase family protein n=1 Tax=Terriglobus aquaticus TaxID=940139 RepID=A0ABW9KHI9_9BACT|nr:flavin reductase family protein [Terriglobus aquaticus]
MSETPQTTEPFLHFQMDTMKPSDSYKLLAALVVPRPIAWVVTQDANGIRNAAPYSFFNILSTDPPLLAVSFSAASDRDGKDSLANLRATGELVVNLVPEELAEAMSITAIDAPRGVDELAYADLALADSISVKPPRIAGSPAAFECVVHAEVPAGSNTIVLARIQHAHVRRSAFSDIERLHLDPAQLRLIGRMGGGTAGGYCRTQDLFEVPRPSWNR